MKGNIATYLGNKEFPWFIQASLNYTSKSGAQLIYQTAINVVNGYANFTQLGISDKISRFVIAYRILLPQGVNYKLENI